MPDIREILGEGADVEPGLPDVPVLFRRGQLARRRRTAVVAVATAACVAAVLSVATLVVPRSWTSSPAPVSPPAARPLPATGPLAAGLYDASALGLAVRFTVPGPGWVLTMARDGWVELRHGRTTISVQDWDAVVDPHADPVGPADTQGVPEDVVAWLVDHPALDTDDGTPAVLGRQTWTAVELRVTRALSTTPAECNTLPCVLLGVVDDEPMELLARDRARVLVPAETVGATPVVVLTRPAGRASTDAAAERLVASLDPG